MKKIFLLIQLILATVFLLNTQELTQAEIDILKNNPELINEIQFENSTQVGPINTGNDKSLDDLSAENIDNQSSNKFGFDFIKKIPQSISSTSDLPVPNDYILALGDELKIILTGGKREIYKLPVGLDGSILFPELGEINVFGETISSVRKKIENLIDLSYVGTEVSVGIQKLSARKINIVGAVNNPGTFIINPFSTITSALSYSGGFSEFASVRDIRVIRGKNIIYFDLYDLLISGNRESDVNIQQGDTILVSSTNNYISVKGRVNRPLMYEFKDDETVSDVINFAMGLESNANPNKIAVIDYTNDFKEERVSEVKYEDNVPLNTFNAPKFIEVFDIARSRNLQIKVLGPVENKGFFQVSMNGDIHEILEKLKFTKEINPYIAVLQSQNSSALFSLNDPTTHDLDIASNSEIIFFTKEEDIFDQSFLSVRSLSLLRDYALKVNYAGSSDIVFPFYGEIYAKEVVEFLGLDMSGFFADQTSYLAPLDDVALIGNFEELSFKASRYNSLTLRAKLDNTLTVIIDGEVNFPGVYALNNGITLSELYEIAGGYKPEADDGAIIFKRDRLAKQNLVAFRNTQEELKKTLALGESSIDPRLLSLVNAEPDEDALGRISGDLSISSKYINDFLLEDGDTIFVPQKVVTVSVVGEVMNGTSHIYQEGMSLRDVINLSGGYTQRALKKSVYIIRSNGSIVKQRGIFRTIDIMPGDTIIVPTDFNYEDDMLTRLVLPLTSLLSNLAFSAAAIDNLRQ